MHQQRRLSPAPSSPCPRMHSNRMQFLQYVPSQQQYNQQPIVLKTEELRPQQQQNVDKENMNPKIIQSNRLVSQYDTPQQSQRSLQQIPVGAFQNQNNNNEIQKLREEMLRMFEYQRKDNEQIKQDYEINRQELERCKIEIDQQKQELIEQKNLNQNLQQQIKELNKELNKTETIFQNDIDLLKNQIQLLKDELQKQQEIQIETQQKTQQQTEITLDTYDTYIKKYEQFNKQVNDYLLNRKLPECQYDTNQIEEQQLQQQQQQPLMLTKQDMDKYKMSIIHENDNEEDEIIYQVDENGYVMNQDGNHLVDNFGRLIQLSEKDIEYFRSRNQLDEIK